jgi:D-alanine-D-alanine ligase
MPPLRICVLTSSYEGSASPFKGHDPEPDPLPHLAGHEVEVHGIHKATAVAEVRALVQRGFDVVVNLCDGAWDEDRAGIEVVQTLERLGAAFTGAASPFYDPSRESMKLACHYAGVATPRFVVARTPADIARAAEHLRFPLIVKHPQGYGSIGMTKRSRVERAADLPAEAERMIGAYGAVLIEEFIEGREFTVLVAESATRGGEPRVFAPIEVRFPAGESFKHFDLKWIDFRGMSWVPVDDAGVAARVAEASARMFSAIGGSGYGRCDLRMDASGIPYVLEVNPNCGIFMPPDETGSADEILAIDPAGPRGFLEHVLAVALRRRDERRPLCEVRHDPILGWGLHATRDVAAGEVVERHEERPVHLVSRRHAERTFDAVHRRWLAEYAWPVGDGVLAMWSDRPEDWRPLNHSCDPNCWLDGLDVVARRPLRAGDAVTLDYATFCGPDTAEFLCRCGTALCRALVGPRDHLDPVLRARYAGHLSDWVERAVR